MCSISLSHPFPNTQKLPSGCHVIKKPFNCHINLSMGAQDLGALVFLSIDSLCFKGCMKMQSFNELFFKGNHRKLMFYIECTFLASSRNSVMCFGQRLYYKAFYMVFTRNLRYEGSRQ